LAGLDIDVEPDDADQLVEADYQSAGTVEIDDAIHQNENVG
jgi:hypothetical protein